MGSRASAPDSKQPPDRAALLPPLLEEVLPRELADIVTGYAVCPPHLWDRNSSPYISVSRDGLSFAAQSGKPLAVGEACFVWSTRTLADGPSRWTVVLPARELSVWLGIGDVRTRHAPNPENCHVGPWTGEWVMSSGQIEDSHQLVGRLTGPTNVRGDRRAVCLAYDGTSGILSVGLEAGGELEPVFGGLPDFPQFLVPIVVASADTLRGGCVYFIESDD